MIAASVVVAMAVAPGAQAAPAVPSAPSGNGYTPAQPGPYKVGHAVSDGKLKFEVKKADEAKDVDVFVKFTGLSSYSAWTGQKARGDEAARSASLAKRAAINSTAKSVLGAARAVDPQAKVIYTSTNLVPGVAIRASGKALKALVNRRDVVNIARLVPKNASNAGAAQLTRVLNTWQSTGALGDDVTVGIIDTGIDYTHADFGGPGTVAAYTAAEETSDGAWTPDPDTNVVGGYDFSGDDYNANEEATATPAPDPNPLDCNSHGTHVAGTVAGRGVAADGSTFDGDYTSLTKTSLEAMRIGPGMAPNASLYGLKVFGCEGSTNLTGEALNWALDPNGDGNFSDHLDIVNLSLGSDFATEDDPDNELVDTLAATGVLPVIAMGNGGDTTDVGGAPGNAVRALTVANSVDAFSLLDGIKATAPASVVGTYAGQVSVAYPWATAPPVSGTVAAIPGSNADGCSPFSAGDAAKVVGKIAWLEWDDNDATRRCGSAGRSANARTAGAIGAVFTSTLNTFAAGITGDATIPVFQLTGDTTDALRASATAGDLELTFDGSLTGTVKFFDNAVTDTLNSSSSRGPRGVRGGIVKPDVAAPGTSITSAGMGTGAQPLTISGTSMATPHVAGIAALVKQVHPTWTTEQIKASIMNTAGNDVYTGENKTGIKYAPNRVGSGRVDALNAVNNDLLVYSATRTGGVSVSFGLRLPPITETTSVTSQKVKIQNTASVGRNVTVSYQAGNTNPGIAYTVSPSTVYVGARATAQVTVTMTVKPALLRHKIDPTMAVSQLNAYTGLSEPRQFVADASGRLIVKDSTTGASLRVPVYGTAEATSTTKAAKGLLAGKPAITLTGKGNNGPDKSLVSVLVYGGSNGTLPRCTETSEGGCVGITSDRAADLENVGVGSAKGPSGTYEDGYLWFGLQTRLPWATIGHSTVPYVNIYLPGDNRNGLGSYTVYGLASPEGTDGQNDVMMAATQDNRTGDLVSVLPFNYSYGDVDTNVFDTNTLLLPTDPAVLGITRSTVNFGIGYKVGIYSNFTGLTFDEIYVPSFNVTQPWVSAAAPIFSDQGGTAIPIVLGKHSKVGQTKAMVVHLHGQPTRKVDIVTVK